MEMPQPLVDVLGRKADRMNFKNFYLRLTKRFGDLQAVSDTYWQRSTNTYLASPDYYKKRHEAIKEALGNLPRADDAIDVGCGDGRFTLEIAARAASTIGYDISPALISKAQTDAQGRPELNVQFAVAPIENVFAPSPVDIVACLGVLSCIIDEPRYAEAIGKLANLLKRGGHLILIDSLNEKKSIVRTYGNGYVAIYRRRADYEARIQELGLHLVSRMEIAAMGRGTTNYLYVLKR